MCYRADSTPNKVIVITIFLIAKADSFAKDNANSSLVIKYLCKRQEE
jgi:hypothetical protein